MAKIDLSGTVDGAVVEQAAIGKVANRDVFDALVSVRDGDRTVTGHVWLNFDRFSSLQGADHAAKSAAVRAKLVETLKANWPAEKFNMDLQVEDGEPKLIRLNTGGVAEGHAYWL